MKRILRPMLLMALLASLLCVNAFAKTETETVDGVEITHPDTVAGEKVKFSTQTGATVQVEAVDDSNEYFKVSATGGVQDAQYLLLVLKEKDGGGFATTPTASDIIYIDQTTADASGKITFDKVYPSSIAMKKSYEAHIVGGTEDNLKAYADSMATFSYDYVTFTLGDVDDSGTVDANDALIALKIGGGLYDATPTEYDAANVVMGGNEDAVNANDALRILQYGGNIIQSW